MLMTTIGFNFDNKYILYFVQKGVELIIPRIFFKNERLTWIILI